MDPSQDYVLLSGKENSTHTTLRFRRKLRTCDEKYDVSITVSLTFKFSMVDKDDENQKPQNPKWQHFVTENFPGFFTSFTKLFVVLLTIECVSKADLDHENLSLNGHRYQLKPNN